MMYKSQFKKMTLMTGFVLHGHIYGGGTDRCRAEGCRPVPPPRRLHRHHPQAGTHGCAPGLRRRTRYCTRTSDPSHSSLLQTHHTDMPHHINSVKCTWWMSNAEEEDIHWEWVMITLLTSAGQLWYGVKSAYWQSMWHCFVINAGLMP